MSGMRTVRLALLELSTRAVSVISVMESPLTSTADDPAAELARLKAEIELLKSRLPSQSHAMMDVDYHFANLWFAGQSKNWPLAQFYLNETRSPLRWEEEQR
jgi:hypothetical protein